MKIGGNLGKDEIYRNFTSILRKSASSKFELFRGENEDTLRGFKPENISDKVSKNEGSIEGLNVQRTQSMMK